MNEDQQRQEALAQIRNGLKQLPRHSRRLELMYVLNEMETEERERHDTDHTTAA